MCIPVAEPYTLGKEVRLGVRRRVTVEGVALTLQRICHKEPQKNHRPTRMHFRRGVGTRNRKRRTSTRLKEH